MQRPSHEEVHLIIKSPSSEMDAPLRLSVSLHGTVGDIKECLMKQHPEHPHPSEQRLIFAGKLLADHFITADVLRQVGCSLRRTPDHASDQNVALTHV